MKQSMNLHTDLKETTYQLDYLQLVTTVRNMIAGSINDTLTAYIPLLVFTSDDDTGGNDVTSVIAPATFRLLLVEDTDFIAIYPNEQKELPAYVSISDTGRNSTTEIESDINRELDRVLQDELEMIYDDDGYIRYTGYAIDESEPIKVEYHFRTIVNVA